MILIKVLVCGSYKGAFQKKLNQRLKKEKHDVFVLNNDSVVERKPTSVFQDYRFPYGSESVMSVMSSASPEVVIFCGALDESYNDGEKISQSVGFVSGLMNVITCAVAANVKRFIYISTEDVFSGSEAEVYDEETVAAPINRWEKALLQGERLCFTSNQNEEMEIAVIRMPHVYGACQDSIIPGVCANFIESFSENMPITLNTNVSYNLIYLDDAIEGVYRVLKADSKDLQELYHIAPNRDVTEKEIYEILSKESGKKPTVINREDLLEEEKKTEQKYISTTQGKLGFYEKFTLEEGLALLYKQYISIEKRQEDKAKVTAVREKRKVFVPIIETILAFCLVQLFVSLTHSFAFHEVVDVYLVFTLVVAVVLGALPSTLAVGLSVVGKYYMLFATGHTMDVFSQYENYLWILQLFALSVLTGYVRDRYTRTSSEMKAENKYLKNELESIKAINDSNIEVKEVFENRLANYKDSYVKVYEIISQLDELESKAIIFKAASVVADIMKSDHVAIYTYEEQSDFCRLMASTSDEAKGKGKSFRLGDYAKVKENLVNKKIFMNREFQEGLPMYAVGTYNEGRLEVVTMIWEVDLIDVNLHQSNLLSMLGKLLERSMSRALRYMDSIKSSTYVEGTNVMESSAFHQMLDVYCTGEAQNLLEYTLLQVDATVEENGDLYNILNSITRGTDYIGLDKKGKIYVLLTNSSEKDAVGVAERFRNKGVSVQIVKKHKGKAAKEVFLDAKF